MSLRILHVIPSVAPCRGGPSKAILEMVRALNDIDINAEIATTNDACNTTLPVNLESRTDYQNTPVRFFHRFSPPIKALREFQYSSHFSKWLATHIHAYDVIHIHAIFSYCSSYAMWLARKHKIPYVVRPIGQLEDWSLQQKPLKKNLFLQLVERKNIQQANCLQFTAQSEQQQALDKFICKDSIVIPLGVNLPEIIPDAKRRLRQKYQLSGNDKILTTVSRIHKKKGLDVLLKALSQITDEPYKLLIAGEGDGEYISELQSLIASLNLQDKVKWLGFIEGEDKNTLLQGADLFALTSHSENFGISVIESLAAGTPVIVSNKVALSEHVDKHQLGYVSEMSQTSIEHTLQHAFDDLDSKTSKGQRARAYVETHFQWSKIAVELQQTYQKILS